MDNFGTVLILLLKIFYFRTLSENSEYEKNCIIKLKICAMSTAIASETVPPCIRVVRVAYIFRGYLTLLAILCPGEIILFFVELGWVTAGKLFLN